MANRFTAWEATTSIVAPNYPVAYDAGKALHAVAKAAGESGYGAQWAGQGAPLVRPLPAATLVALLQEELGVAAPGAAGTQRPSEDRLGKIA